jgi:hypothetical protein
MRDLRARNGANGSGERPGWLAELFEQFGESRIESWDERTWEASTLEVLWRICRGGAAAVPDFAPPRRSP